MTDLERERWIGKSPVADMRASNPALARLVLPCETVKFIAREGSLPVTCRRPALFSLIIKLLNNMTGWNGLSKTVVVLKLPLSQRLYEGDLSMGAKSEHLSANPFCSTGT